MAMLLSGKPCLFWGPVKSFSFNKLPKFHLHTIFLRLYFLNTFQCSSYLPWNFLSQTARDRPPFWILFEKPLFKVFVYTKSRLLVEEYREPTVSRVMSEPVGNSIWRRKQSKMHSNALVLLIFHLFNAESCLCVAKIGYQKILEMGK